MSVTALSWRYSAACRGEDPELFFSPDGESPAAREVREAQAKAVCASCEVTGPCLDFRLSFERQRDDDVWAGFDGDERSAMRHALVKRQQRRAA